MPVTSIQKMPVTGRFGALSVMLKACALTRSRATSRDQKFRGDAPHRQRDQHIKDTPAKGFGEQRA